jgi:signal transduction histidine kinase
MNWAGGLKDKSSLEETAAQLALGWPNSPCLSSPRQERRRSAVITLLLTSLLAFLFYGVFSLFSLAYSQLIAALSALLLFTLFFPWLETILERQFHPERLAYRQLVEVYGQVAHQTPNLDITLSSLSRTLCDDLKVPSATVWLYQPEDNLLTLVQFEGNSSPDVLYELPVDVELKCLWGRQLVATLPESALRQGLLTMQVSVVAALSLREELVGLIGLGGFHPHQTPPSELLQVLEVLAGQLALVVKNGRLITDLEETLNKLQLAYRRTIDTQEEERRKLAVELHDDILSRLTTMGMTLRNSQRQLTSDTAKVQLWLEMLEQETRYLNIRLREITQGLHPAILADLGLIAALQAYMDSLTKHALPALAPCTIDLTAQGFDCARIPDPKLERDIYYLTRQALDNALKHAQAEQILIHLRWRDDAVTVTVQDNGVGLKAGPEQLMGQQGHLGLLSMHERVLAWRGRLSLQSTPGRGASVYARLPISQPSPNPSHLQAFTCYLKGEIGN